MTYWTQPKHIVLNEEKEIYHFHYVSDSVPKHFYGYQIEQLHSYQNVPWERHAPENIKIGNGWCHVVGKMKLVRKFKSFVSKIITTSEIKTSVQLYHMVKAMVQKIDITHQMMTYPCIHDIVLAYDFKNLYSSIAIKNVENSLGVSLKSMFRSTLWEYFYRLNWQ